MANLDGMPKKELILKLRECRKKQAEVAREKCEELGAAIKMLQKTMGKKFNRRLKALFMWDRLYCEAINEIERSAAKTTCGEHAERGKK